MGLLSSAYGFGLACRKFVYDNLKKPNTLPAKVVSIGNLTLGGTGKTPAVIALASEARERGLSPCVLTRGYRGKAKDTSFVSKGSSPLMSPVEAGDEAFLIAETLRGIPVVKGRNRYEAGLFAISSLSSASSLLPSLFILDDGFQHIALHRDIDVLLIDATNPFGNEKLFPEGIMREPFDAISRAHFIAITKSDMAGQEAIASITERIKKYNPEVPIYHASHKPTGLVNVSGELEEFSSIGKRKILAFAGIANPAYFQSILKEMGADIVKFRKFRDHYIYNKNNMEDIIKDADGMDIITTEKDLVKLKGFNLPDNIYALRIEFSIDNSFYDNIFRRLQ